VYICSMRTLTLCILLFACSLNATAQSEHNAIGNWLMYFGQNRISDKWSIHSEFQYRAHKPVPIHTNQLMLRAGINYHFGPASFISAGYAFIPTHFYETPQTEAETLEHRFWQQFFLKNTINYLTVRNRYRLEERWINGNYRTRFRYMIDFVLPITNARLIPKTFYARLYDEIFINSKQTYFDRNRLYIGAGYKFSNMLSLEIGFMHQQTNTLGKRQLQFGMVFNPDFRKNTELKKVESQEKEEEN
jgi:hypothetical protein